MKSKKRGTTTLKPHEYDEIGASTETTATLMQRYGVSRDMISNIRQRMETYGSGRPRHFTLLTPQQERAIGVDPRPNLVVQKEFKIGKKRYCALRAKFKAQREKRALEQETVRAHERGGKRMSPFKRSVPLKRGRPPKQYVEHGVLADMLKAHGERLVTGLKHEVERIVSFHSHEVVKAYSNPLHAMHTRAKPSRWRRFTDALSRLKLRMVG